MEYLQQLFLQVLAILAILGVSAPAMIKLTAKTVRGNLETDLTSGRVATVEQAVTLAEREARLSGSSIAVTDLELWKTLRQLGYRKATHFGSSEDYFRKKLDEAAVLVTDEASVSRLSLPTLSAQDVIIVYKPGRYEGPGFPGKQLSLANSLLTLNTAVKNGLDYLDRVKMG